MLLFVRYVRLKACITRLPDNGYGANVTLWPTRLHYPPDRLFTIEMDAYISRKDIYKADSKYWNDNVSGYVAAFHLKKLKLRNVLDMRALYGGYLLYTLLSLSHSFSFTFYCKMQIGENLKSKFPGDFAYGRFAAALHDHGVDCWVMNVVPVSGANTLPVIYDRGLVGVVHDWYGPVAFHLLVSIFISPYPICYECVGASLDDYYLFH